MKFSKVREQMERGEQLTAPTEFINHLNKNAPMGTHFESDDNVHFTLKEDNCSEERIKFIVKLPKEFKGVKLSSSEDLSILLYRSQQSIEIFDVKYIIGDSLVAPEEARKMFGGKINYKQSKYFLEPVEPSPDPVDIRVWFGEKEYTFVVEHQPYPSIDEMKFESIDEDIFKLAVSINLKTDQIKINFTYNFNKASSLNSIFEQKEKLLDFATGDVKILGHKLAKENLEVKESIIKSLDFYERLDKVSKKLCIQFDIEKTVMISDYVNLNKLFYSLIEDKYYFLSKNRDKGTLTVEINESKSDEKLPVDFYKNAIAISGYEQTTINLLDQKFDCVEQFIYKEVKYSGVREGNSHKFDVLGDKIKYQKIFFDEQPEEIQDFNFLEIDSKNAAEIEAD
ncbi:abortive infection system toxin AbiGii family protein [Listeria monocytogenes]|nr:hypothetical protein [Listeria monocytogenes]EAE8492058.1 hypothetical protein [Listeria monocytogenes]EAE9317856.1 hypothetical protein [Listeria monocytogenes]EAF4983993.1 hypothetical protein [Listeria monocytogenes]EAF7125104.1 hypothetical protein [Listeria monocytogenes]